MSKTNKGNRFNISFKENVYDVELMVYMQEKAKIMGLSSYIKMLIKEDMERNKEKNK